MEKQYRHKLPDLTIKTEGVEKLLKNIVTSKACGPDNIPNIILKNCAVQFKLTSDNDHNMIVSNILDSSNVLLLSL